jgi:hypothetical protein
MREKKPKAARNLVLVYIIFAFFFFLHLGAWLGTRRGAENLAKIPRHSSRYHFFHNAMASIFKSKWRTSKLKINKKEEEEERVEGEVSLALFAPFSTLSPGHF